MVIKRITKEILNVKLDNLKALSHMDFKITSTNGMHNLVLVREVIFRGDTRSCADFIDGLYKFIALTK